MPRREPRASETTVHNTWMSSAEYRMPRPNEPNPDAVASPYHYPEAQGLGKLPVREFVQSNAATSSPATQEAAQ